MDAMSAAAGAVKTRIAIIGGGASALFVLNEYVARNDSTKSLDIFEAGLTFGSGMPYSKKGANAEHLTNLSCEEIPDLTKTVDDWLREQPAELLAQYGIQKEQITRELLLPRLLFGKYLEDQFEYLLKMAEKRGLQVTLHPGSRVSDISDDPANDRTRIRLADGDTLEFNNIVITTGHVWPDGNEKKVKSYFDSPYPPSKLSGIFNQHVGLRGSSLTSVDAIKTLAIAHGRFERDAAGTLTYEPNPGTDQFKITMHSRHGLLPCIRFHFDNPRVVKDLFISERQIEREIARNKGFLPLDFIFNKGFKEPLKSRDPELYQVIKNMNLEQFVEFAFKQRTAENPFEFFAQELELSKASLASRQSLPWKEMIIFLMFTINFSAKYMPAEDMLRVRQTLAPLSSHIVAYLPIESSEEILALHKAGKLDIVAVGYDSALTPDKARGGATYTYKGADGQKRDVHFETFIDCTGQRQLPFREFPFKSLLRQGAASPATLQFSSAQKALFHQSANPGLEISEAGAGAYRLTLPGVAIDDNFLLVDAAGRANPRIGIMAVPLIGGYNPDFSALDVAENASKLVMDAIYNHDAEQVSPIPPTAESRRARTCRP